MLFGVHTSLLVKRRRTNQIVSYFIATSHEVIRSQSKLGLSLWSDASMWPQTWPPSMYTSTLRLPLTSPHEGRKLCSARTIIARSTLHNSKNWLHNGSNWFCRVIVILFTLRPGSRKPLAFASDIHSLHNHFKEHRCCTIWTVTHFSSYSWY